MLEICRDAWVVEVGGLQNRLLMHTWVRIPLPTQTMQSSCKPKAHRAVGHRTKQIWIDEMCWVCYHTTCSDTPKYSWVALVGRKVQTVNLVNVSSIAGSNPAPRAILSRNSVRSECHTDNVEVVSSNLTETTRDSFFWFFLKDTKVEA